MKRIATAAVLVPLVTYVALWGPQWLFLLVTAAVALLCFHEFAGIVAGHKLERPTWPEDCRGLGLWCSGSSTCSAPGVPA